MGKEGRAGDAVPLIRGVADWIGISEGRLEGRLPMDWGTGVARIL